jgi:transposase
MLLDNTKFHHNKNVKDFIINSNNNFLYTVRYHSENNPIENFFNQMKLVPSLYYLKTTLLVNYFYNFVLINVIYIKI